MMRSHRIIAFGQFCHGIRKGSGHYGQTIWLEQLAGRIRLVAVDVFSSTQGVFPSSKASYWESYCIAKCTCWVLGPCGSLGLKKGKSI